MDNIIALLHQRASEILYLWTRSPKVSKIFANHWINCDFFCENYWQKIIQYIISVFEGKKQVWDCPFMMMFLRYLQDRQISTVDLYIICFQLRKEFVNAALSSVWCDKEMVVMIHHIFDENFKWVLVNYTSLLNTEIDKINEAKQQLERLNEHFREDIEVKTTALSEYKHAMDASIAITKTDPKGIITHANDLFCQISWYEKEELIWRPHNIVRHKDTHSETFQEMWQAIKDKKIWKWLVKNKRKNGWHQWFATTIAPILDSAWEIKEFIAMRVDVTELQNAKAKLRTSFDKLKMIDRVKDEFIWIASHELRTPLTVIKWYASILIEWVFGILLPKQQECVEKIFRNTNTLISHINNMLDIDKLRLWKMEFKKEQILLPGLINELIQEYDVLFKKKNISLSFLNKTLIKWSVEADNEKLKQVFANLLSNAFKFTGDNWSVIISIGKYPINKKFILVQIKDSWIGIPKDKQRAIFNKFKQLGDYLEKKYEWTGLWLPIVKNIIKNFNWKVWLESCIWKWTTFKFTLPIK